MNALAQAPILIRPNFIKILILDVDWSIKGVGTIILQKTKRNDQVVTYASKGLSPIEKKVHPMEGECYALIWGIDDEQVEGQEENVGDKQDNQVFKRRKKDLWDIQMHLQLIDEVHALVDADNVDWNNSQEEEDGERIMLGTWTFGTMVKLCWF